MAIRYLAAWAVALLAACSSPKASQTAATTGPGSGDQAVAGPTDSEVETESLTEADCMALLDHYLAVASAEKPEEARPSPEQLAEIRSGMVDAARKDCVGQPRSGSYQCAMQATSSQAIGQCLSGPGGPK